MSTPMPIPGEKSEVVGSIVNRHVTENAENYHCCTWDIVKPYSSSYKLKEFKSPIFTVSNRDECKWYLNLEIIRDLIRNRYVICHLRLVLDRESECKKASGKYKLTILRTQEKHKCNLNSSETFELVRKSKNSAGFMTVLFDEDIRDASFSGFVIVCEMKIEISFSTVNSLSNDLGSLLKNDQLTDVVLSVGKKKFPAHKLILAARSSVFAAMFAHNMVENRGEVQIVDMSEEVVEEMLRFIYTGKVKKLNDLAPDLLMAADKYDLKGLLIKSEKVLIDDLSSSNVLDMIALAKLYNATQLKIKAKEFFMKTGVEIMKTPDWKNLGESNYDLLKELCEAFMKREIFV